MNKTILKAVLSAALLAGAPVLMAQSLTAPTASGVINNPAQTFTIAFDSVNTAGVDFDLTTSPAGRITITGATSTFGANCAVAMAGAGLICNAFAASGFLADGSVTVTYTAAATTGPVALTLANVVFRDENGAVQPIPPAVVTNGTLTLNAGPSGPTLTYNPAATTPIVVPASISGTAITTSIAVTSAGGDTGENTTLACTVSGTGYVSTVTGSPFPGGSASSGTVGLGCAGTAAAQTLTCTETRSGTGGGAAVVSTWPLTCAAAPGFASTPAPGGTITIVGVTGSTATGSVGLSNPGTAPLTVTGAVTGAAGLTLGTVTSPIASGGTGAATVSCAVPAQAGTTITGTLTLTTNATPATATYTVNCLAQSASIPTLGFGGKALMVLLMLGFGLVGFQLYRRSA